MVGRRRGKEVPLSSRLLSVLLSVTLVIGLMPSLAYADDAAQSQSSKQDTEVVQTDIDIADAWESGALTLSEAGTYVLSRDVETDGTLSVNAAEDKEIVIDFAGHTATVKGAVYAGIDVSGSEGMVVIKDSVHEEEVARAAEEGEETPAASARLTVEANKVDDAVAGILANYAAWEPAESDEKTEAPVPVVEVRDINVEVNLNTVAADSSAAAHDAYGIYTGYAADDDARDAVRALVDGCSVSVRLNNIEQTLEEREQLRSQYGEAALDVDHTGVAYGVYTNAKGVELDGAFSSETQSVTATCDLYSTVEEGFSVSEGFSPVSDARVYAQDNNEGTVFASLATGFTANDEFLAKLVDASGKENKLAEHDGKLVFSKDGEDGANDGSGESSAQESPLSAGIQYVEGSAVETDNAEPAEEQRTWTVLSADGSEAGSYDSFDKAQAALEPGGTARLNADLGRRQMGSYETADAVLFSKGAAGESYTVDLAGHALGAVQSTSAADLAVVSSAGRATLTGYRGNPDGTDASDTNAVVQAGSGSMSVSGADVAMDLASGSAEAGAANVSGVKMAARAEGSLSVSGASVSVRVDSTSSRPAVAGAKALAGSGPLSLSGVTISAEQASATTSGTTRGVSSVSESAVSLDGVSAAASGQNSPVSLYATKGEVSLAGECSLPQGASLTADAARLSVAASFSSAAPVAVACAAGRAAAFAVAGEGCDLASKAALFAPAAGSAFEGMEASYSEGAGGLVWAEPAEEQRTLSFDANGGKGVMDTLTDDDGDGFIEVPECSFVAPIVQSRESAFHYWTTSADGTGSVYYPGDLVPVNSGVTLYAKWDIVCYVIFHTYAYQYRNGVIDYEHVALKTITYKGFPGEPITTGTVSGNRIQDSGATVEYQRTFPEVDLLSNQELRGFSVNGVEVDGLDASVLPEVFSEETITVQALVRTIAEDAPATGEPIDLYELLTDNGVPKTGNVTLSYQGEYYLSQPVEGYTGSIIVDKGGSYSIDLRGNSITFGTGREEAVSESAYGIQLAPGSNVSGIDVSIVSTDGNGAAKQGSLSFVNGGRIWLKGESNTSESLRMDHVDVSKTYTLEDSLTTFAGSSAIVVENTLEGPQQLSLDSCNVSLDVSNQRKGGGSSLSTSHTNVATAVRVASISVADVSVENSTISTKAGTPDKAEGSAQQSVDAIALYVAASKADDAAAVSVADSTLSATASQGSAYALFNDKLRADSPEVELSGEVVLAATGAGEGSPLSIGLLNTVGQHGTAASATDGPAAVLNGTVAFSTKAASNAYALAADQTGSSAAGAPFVLGEQFAAETALPVVAGLAYDYGTNAGNNYSGTITQRPVKPVGVSSSANGAGMYAARFADGVGAEAQEAMAAALTNGVAGSNTVLAADGSGVAFQRADGTVAAAYIDRDGAHVEYDTFEAATADAKAGETVVLACDVNGTATIEAGAVDQVEALANLVGYTVDLNGHTVKRLVGKTAQNVTVTDSTGQAPALAGVLVLDGTAKRTSAVEQAGTGTLTLDGVGIDIQNVDDTVYGVLATAGTVVLSDVQVRVHLASSQASGAGVRAAGGSVQVQGGSVGVEAPNGATDVAGVAVAAAGSTVQLSGSEVSAHGAFTKAAAASASAGTLSASDTTFAASGFAAADEVYGARASGSASVGLAGCTVSVEAGSSVESAGAAAETAWAVYAGSATSSAAGNPQVMLSGATSLSCFNGNGVYHKGNALRIGADFALASGAALAVQSDGVEGDVFAVPAEDGGSLAGKEGLFAAADAAGNGYAGWQAQAKADGSLAWASDEVAAVLRTSGDGAEAGRYTSLAAAVNAAQAGDTVRVLHGFATAGIAVAKDVTLDLAGHAVDMSAATSTAASVSAGRLTVADSAAGAAGQLNVSVQISSVTTPGAFVDSADGLAVNCVGIRVGSGAGLTIDGAAVSVVYGGFNTVPALTGVYAPSGAADGSPAVLLQGGARLSVASSADAAGSQAQAVGAMKTYGIYARGSSSHADVAVRVDEGSAVSVRSAQSMLLQQTDTTSQGSTVGNDGVYLRPFSPDESSDLYKEIVAKFKQVAQFDGSATAGQPGAKYGAQVYYAAPLQLSSGLYVWAFSDVVAGEDMGKDSAIVPTHMYIAGDVQVSPDAVGIADTGYAGTVIEVAGAVSASSANGNAYALLTGKGSTWRVDGATLAAETQGEGMYWRLSNYAPDLKEALGIAVAMGDNGFNFYGNSGVRGAEEASVEAAGIAVREVGSEHYNRADAAVEIDGAVDVQAEAPGGVAAGVMVDAFAVGDGFAASQGSVTVLAQSDTNAYGDVFATAAGDAVLTEAQANAFADPDGAFAPVLAGDGKSVSWGYGTVSGTAELTFANVRDASGAAVADTVLAVSDGAALGEAAASAPQPADYGTYKFVGWKASVPKENSTGTDGRATMVDRVIDPNNLDSYEVSGDAVLTASYVNVAASQQLVAFKVDDYVYAYAVDGGALPTYKAALSANGEADSATLNRDPQKYESGTSWTFAGWTAGRSDVRDPYAAPDYAGSSALLAAAVAGGEAAWYTASFTEGDATSVTVTLHYFNQWGTDGTWYYNTTTSGTIGQMSVPYGTDINTSVSYGENLKDGKAIDYVESASGTYRAHRFLGWSTRPTDKEPLGDALPKAGEGSTNYYAIYSDEEMKVQATFVGADGEQCTVAVGASATVADAMAAEGYAIAVPEGKKLAGWAYEAGAEAPSVTSYATARVSGAETLAVPQNGDGKTEGTATYYAVFADADPVTVTLHADGTDWTSDVVVSNAVPGVPLSDETMEGYRAPIKRGYAFVGWNSKEDGTGRAFDVASDPVPNEGIELWAQYVAIEAADVPEGAAIDVSGAYVNSEAAVGASAVAVSLVEADAADAGLALSANYPTLQAYRVQVTVTRGETEQLLTSGFGALQVSVPVPSAYADRDLWAYILGADGKTVTARATASGSGAGSVATFAVSGYGATTQGNIAFVYGATSDERQLASAKQQAKDQLNAAYAGYSQDNYEGDESTGTWGDLTKAYEAGLVEIDAATTVAGVQSAAQAAVDAMAAVPSKTALAQAKAEALERLATAFAGYKSSDYSTANWSALQQAYESAKSAVQSAATSDAAFTAASDGILAMNAVQAGGSGTGTGSGTTGGATSGLSSGGSSGVTATSGLSSGSASSGLSSGSGSSGSATSGLDSAEGTSDDAASGLSLTSDTARMDDAAGDGDAGQDGSQPTGLAAVGAWIGDHLVFVIVGALVLIAAVSALVWWLLRRRNDAAGGDDDDDFWGDEDGGGAAPAGSPA